MCSTPFQVQAASCGQLLTFQFPITRFFLLLVYSPSALFNGGFALFSSPFPYDQGNAGLHSNSFVSSLLRFLDSPI